MDSRLLDKPWRLSHLYSITGKDGGEKLQFKPNQAQQELFSVLKDKKRVIVLKARQLGITTASSIWFLDDVLFRRNINSLSVLQSRDHAISAFDGKVHFAWNNLNQNLKAALGWSVDISRANQLSFAFGDGSSSSYVVSTSGRSGTFQNVHLSELAALCAERPNDAKEVITGTIPAVPNDGLILIESTAQGETGYFADYWRDAVTGKNGFHPLFFNWRWDKEEIQKMSPLLECPPEFRDLAKTHALSDKETAYLVAKWRSLGCDWSLLRQEYPTTPEEAFMSSTEKFFDIEAIDDFLLHADYGERKGSTVFYQAPRPGRTYAIGADPSEGVGRDHSAAVVLEVDGVKPKVVATYADASCPPEDFAHILKSLSTEYNSAVIAVERNNHGHAVLATLKHVYDEDLLYRQQDPSMVSSSIGYRLGFNSNAATKPLILHSLAQVIRERSVLIPSKELLEELRMYPRSEATKSRTEEGASRHWDLTIAFALALHCSEYALKNGRSGTMGGVTYVPTKELDEFSAI